MLSRRQCSTDFRFRIISGGEGLVFFEIFFFLKAGGRVALILMIKLQTISTNQNKHEFDLKYENGFLKLKCNTDT